MLRNRNTQDTNLNRSRYKNHIIHELYKVHFRSVACSFGNILYTCITSSVPKYLFLLFVYVYLYF